MAVNPRDVHLEMKGKELIVPFADISRAHIEVEFNRKDVK
jgi:ribosome maturation factor RimP